MIGLMFISLMQIFISRNEQTYGPYEEEQIIGHLMSGFFCESDLAWRDGCAEWMPISQMLADSEDTSCAYAPPEVARAVIAGPKPEITNGVRKEKKIDFSGAGAAIQIIGFILSVTIVGAIIGLPFMLVGGMMIRKIFCASCGNQTTANAKVCLGCGSRFIP